ncbi:MAG: MgtC/SapB family protein [Dokdonella sp.]|uniref:MgtC/SapB family protein n=1 Tax=Dokdonella sp. TaxID=2291710 RepID=UPI0032638EA4
MSDEFFTIAFRLGLSAFVGALIGLNRDLHGKPAGVRTHALVSLGTALMVIVVMPPGEDLTHRYDALSRVIQGVLTGIGFLGAGVILRDPGLRQVHGLTTAATIWVTALLGVACGVGAYGPVLLAFAFGALVMVFGGRFERTLRRRFRPVRGDPRESTIDPPS